MAKQTDPGPLCGAHPISWTGDGDPALEGRSCVLYPGYYNTGGEEYQAKSWHTDCPKVIGEYFPEDGPHTGCTDRPCMVWAESGRTGIENPASGPVQAMIRIGDTFVSVGGSVRFTTAMIHAFADALEEDMDR